jgi:hypothetical protein
MRRREDTGANRFLQQQWMLDGWNQPQSAGGIALWIEIDQQRLRACASGSCG